MRLESDREEALDWVLAKLAAAKRQKPTTFAAPKPALTAEQKKADLKERKPKELLLWKEYKDSGWHPKKLDPLIKSFQGLINGHVSMFRNRSEIPTAVVDQTFKTWFAKGLKTYKPEKAQLGTWITYSLQKGHRELNASKQLNYVPENVGSHITAFNVFKSELAERLGHVPNVQTIHDMAITDGHPTLSKLSLKQIKRLQGDQRASLVRTGKGIDAFYDQEHDPRHVEVAHLIIPELNKVEKEVHEFSLGLNGKPKLKSGAIAKKLGISGPQVSRIRTDIFERMRPHIGDL